jgi:hypothetical protein
MSSKRRIRRHQCTGKRRYANLTEAQLYCNSRWKHGVKLRPYTCKFCCGIHVGHLPKKLKQDFARKHE